MSDQSFNNGAGRARRSATFAAAAVAFVVSAALPVDGLVAQAEPRITEVGFEGPGWIEIANVGDQSADLTGWSLYHAYEAPNQVGAAWWPFPNGFALAPQERVVVRWRTAAGGQIPPGEVFTGTRPGDFLFGLTAIDLDPSHGALGLIATQGNAQVGNADFFRDWMSWGLPGLAREELAVAAGLWVENYPASSVVRLPRPSLALDEIEGANRPASGAVWFRDESPTEGRGNHPGLGPLEVSGFGCEFRVRAPVARLVPVSVPAVGNIDFKLRLEHDTILQPGPWIATFIISPFAVEYPVPPPFPAPCRVLVDTTALVTVPIFEGRAFHEFATGVPPEAAGIRLFVQVAIIHVGFGTGDFALSNRVGFQAGG